MDTNKTENCFSKTNFDIVYKYIGSQIKKSTVAFHNYDSYEVYLKDNAQISFKSNGYTLSRIIKDKGIFALPKRKKDNENILKKTNQLFCELVVLAGK